MHCTARTALLALAILLAAALPIAAQSETPEAPPEAISFSAARSAIREASEPADLEAAIAAMEQLADAGELAAAYYLADEYLSPRGAILGDNEKAAQALSRLSEVSADMARSTQISYLGESEDPADRLRALSMLEEDFASGDMSVAAELARAHRSGAYGNDVDIARAAEIYRALVDSGDASARSDLIALLRASDDPQDKLAALSYLQKAFDDGDLSSAEPLANAYRTGNLGNPVDLDKAIPIYQALAATGDIHSAERLATIFRSSAISAHYREEELQNLAILADAGNADALLELASAYSMGEGAPVDLAKAEESYKRAVDLGSDTAALAYAKALSDQVFGPERDAEAVALLRMANERNTPGAAVPLANALLAGKGAEASPQQAIDVLKAAVDRGDASALSVLMTLYIRGRGQSLPPDLPAAAALYNSLPAETITPTIEALGVVIGGARANTQAGWAAFGEELATLSASGKRSVGTQMLTLNPNAYVYLLQTALFEGTDQSPTGMLTSSTVSALNSLCAQNGLEATCRLGPMDRRVWSAVGPVLFPD